MGNATKHHTHCGQLRAFSAWCYVVAAALFLSGCSYDTQQRVDDSVHSLTNHTYDQQPATSATTTPAAASPTPATSEAMSVTALPSVPAPSQSSENNVPQSASNGQSTTPACPATDVQTVSYLETAPAANIQPVSEKRLDLKIPAAIPGAETRRLELSRDPATKQQEIAQLFPELPPLAVEPTALPGPNGQPYTLAALQQIAAANSPQLRQAASDVEAARGNKIQANAYPNPNLSYQFTPSNNGSTFGADGVGLEQKIKTGGKLGLQTAAAEMDLKNAELTLRRARSDLATQVRTAYFNFLVAKESVRINRGVAHLTDEVYRLQAKMLAGGFVAPYEPAALRAQAFNARLAYQQSIQNYIYSWKQLVAALNVRQMPLTEVAGRVDASIPYYDFDAVQAYILRNHTDVLIAQNGIAKAHDNLKLAQVTPVPDVDVNLGVYKDYSMEPKQYCPTMSVGVQIPLWDRNKGGIISAEGAAVRASEEPHRVEQNLQNTLSAAYVNYKNNLEAVEYYRLYILPDQVRAYRGAYERRQVDTNASFGDIVSAQQTLATNVTTYLQTLGQLWTSVVAVADLIQTDDLFQFARPTAVPPLPDLEQLAALPCHHPDASQQGVASNPADSTVGQRN